MIKVIAKKLTGKARKKLPKSSFAVPASHPKNKGKKDKFPISDSAHAKNALSRVNQFSTSPDWWSGSAQELVNTVTRAVKSRYPNIEISDEAKKKKANLSDILDIIVLAADKLDDLGMTKEGTMLDNVAKMLVATEPLKVQQTTPPATQSAKPSSGQVNPDPVQQPEQSQDKKPEEKKPNQPALTSKKEDTQQAQTNTPPATIPEKPTI